MRLAVVGTGYVGLVAGACFASTGNRVTCVDIDEEKIEGLKKGIIPIYEPGLETLVKENVAKERLFFTTDLADAANDSEVIFIAVGTPPDEDGSADLKHVLAVAEGIGKSITDYKVIVDKSTVPVGTAKKVAAKVKEFYNGDFSVVSNPEFLKEGAAIDDFLKPDRVVIGADDERARETMSHLYSPFVRTGHPIVHMDVISAELTKYTANSFLAMKISFMNEIARLCEKVGADVDSVRAGIGSDPRIGRHFLFAGAGYGGSCFPKDVKAIIRTANDFGVNMNLINTTEEVNEAQKKVLFEKITAHYGNDLNGITIAVWGLSFKPNTDDMREAPAIVLINALIQAGAKVRAYDPVAIDNAKGIFGDKIYFGRNEYDVTEGADALAIVTEWIDFRTPDFKALGENLADKVIFDGRNLYNASRVKSFDIKYYAIGKNVD